MEIFDKILKLFSGNDWRQRVREGKGSFRGVPFYIIDDATITGGRRVVRHEYPLREDGESEDVGLTMRQYSFSAVVFGDDYFDKRDALIEALETSGPAEIDHPFWGKLFIQVETFTMKESCSDGGLAMFSVTASPGIDDTAPIVADNEQPDTDSIFDSIIDDVTEAWDTITGAIAEVEAVIAAVEQTINTITNGIRGLAGASGLASLFGSALALKGSISNLIKAPGQLFKDIKNLIGGIAKIGKKSSASRTLNKIVVGIQSQTVSNDPSVAALQSVINTAVVTMAASALVGLTLSIAQEAAKAAPEGPTLTTSDQSQASLTQEAATAESSDEQPIIETLDDTKNVAAALDEQLVDLLITTGDLGWFSTSHNLRVLRLVFLRRMTATAQNLPAAKTIFMTATEPALVTLYRHTGDARNIKRFIRRNGFRYPAFVTGGVEVEIING